MAVDVYDATIKTIVDRNGRDEDDTIKVPSVTGRTWELRPPSDFEAHVLWDDDEDVFAIDADWLEEHHGILTKRDALIFWLTECLGNDREQAISYIEEQSVSVKKAYYRWDPLSAENEWRIEHYCGHGGGHAAEDCSHNNEESRRQSLWDMACRHQYNTPVWTACHADEDGARDFWRFSWE